MVYTGLLLLEFLDESFRSLGDMALASFTAVADLGDHIHPTVRQRLTAVSIPKWIRWTAILWLWVFLVTIVFLGIAVAIHYGPF